MRPTDLRRDTSTCLDITSLAVPVRRLLHGLKRVVIARQCEQDASQLLQRLRLTRALVQRTGEFERRVVVPLRLGVRVDRLGLVAGTQGIRQGARVVARLQEVPGQFCRPARPLTLWQLLDGVARCPVQPPSAVGVQLGVERLLEHDAGLTDEAGDAGLLQRRLQGGVVAPRHARQVGEGEGLAQHACLMQRLLSLGRYVRHPLADDRADALRHLDGGELLALPVLPIHLSEVAALNQGADHLAREEGIAFGALMQMLRQLVRDFRDADRRGDQRGGALQREAPHRYTLEQVLAAQVAQRRLQRMLALHLDIAVRAEEQHARVAGLAGEMLQQGETGRVCPMQVVQQEGDRQALGQRLDEARHLPEEALPIVRRVGRAHDGKRDRLIGQ